MKYCFLIGSAPFLGDIDPKPQEGDFVICADGGYTHALRLGIKPDLVVGDFDSLDIPKEGFPCEVIHLPVEKDDTDMIYAARVALERGFDRLLIIGGLQGRFDHTIANLQLLSWLDDRGASGVLIDGETRVWMLSGGSLVIPAGNRYFSVFAYSDVCPDVSIRGAKYPLEHAVLTSGFPLGVSNEVEGEEATIVSAGGKLLVIAVPKERGTTFSLSNSMK